jgi:SM-20-related protein
MSMSNSPEGVISLMDFSKTYRARFDSSVIESFIEMLLGLEPPSCGPTPYVFYDEFLHPTELEEIANYLLGQEARFTASQVLTADGVGRVDESRKSRVLFSALDVESVFVPRIMSVLPKVIEDLEMEPFTVNRVEMQTTVSAHGDYFRPHRDNGNAKTNRRHLTFVYYAHRQPKPFGGGALRFHWPNGTYNDVAPEQNRIVFFRPSCYHEVVTVSSNQRSLADSRITINGWLWKGALAGHST